MIKLLAQFFREFHYIIGISLPPPGISDRRFVLSWVLGISALLAFGVIIFYTIVALYFRH